jgi:DnaA family protein
LPLRLEDHAAFATLVAGPNATAIAHVRMLTAGGRGETLWLWGPRGIGKTHVLQAACREADAAGQRAMYLPLGSGTGVDPGVLAGLDALDFLALDDLDAVAGHPDWEHALFGVLNDFHAGRKPLLMAASSAPAALAFGLRDLGSRAAGATVYRLHSLTDDDQIEALRLHAKNRGLELEPAAARFLQTRVPRDMPALCDWLHRLDAASLAAKRGITIPLIRDSLAAASGDSM